MHRIANCLWAGILRFRRNDVELWSQGLVIPMIILSVVLWNAIFPCWVFTDSATWFLWLRHLHCLVGTTTGSFGLVSN